MLRTTLVSGVAVKVENEAFWGTPVSDARGGAMAQKRREHGEAAWRNAKTICRLNARQVEMARALGMNPLKLPRLRPSAQQRWKRPVGAFIEECYRKQFGESTKVSVLAGPEPRSCTLGTPDKKPDRDPIWQAQDLICYLANLADDLQKWIARGTLTLDVLLQVREELRDAANALERGAPISPVPGIPVPPPRTRSASWRGGKERTFDDADEIPF